MKKCGITSLLLLLAGCMVQEPVVSEPLSEPVAQPAATPGIALLRLSEDAADRFVLADFPEVADELGVLAAERVFPDAGEFEVRHRAAGLHRWYRVRYDASLPATKAERSLGALPGVEEVRHSLRARPCGYFNDPYSSYQWNLSNPGTHSHTIKGYDINVERVWKEFTTGSSDVIVAVIDGGVDLSHEDLQGIVLPVGSSGSRNFVPGHAADEVIGDGHGTHVGGTIAAVSNNGIGISGIAGGEAGAGGVRLISCQIFCGSGDDVEGGQEEDLANALVWAADHGAVIANNSWGFVFDTEDEAKDVADYFLTHENPVFSAIDYFNAYAGTDVYGRQTGPMKGGICFFASGNEGWRYCIPAQYEPVVAVGSIDADGTMSDYSNYGDWVDILAPGGNDNYANDLMIFATMPGSKYAFMAGTSMATPHVSAVAALLVSYFGGPGYTADMLREQILSGVRQNAVTLPEGRTVGGGLLDAYGSFSYALDPVDPDEANIRITTDYDGDFRIPSHETLELTYRIEGNKKGKFPVSFDTSCPASTATVSSSLVQIHIDALQADPGTYSATISVGKSVREPISFTILENHAPEVVSVPEDLVVNAASATTTTLRLTDYIQDPDGETLDYTVRLSGDGIVTPTLNGSALTFSTQGYGLVEVVLGATDARGARCSTHFQVLSRDTFKEIDVYPNPVSDILYVRPGTLVPTTVRLYSHSGALVFTQSRNAGPFHPLGADVRKLDPGVYTLKVQFGGKELVSNIVKY